MDLLRFIMDEEEIGVRNLTSIDLTFGRVTALFGGTGAGKSNVLEVIAHIVSHDIETASALRWFEHVDIDPTWEGSIEGSVIARLDDAVPHDAERIRGFFASIVTPERDAPPLTAGDLSRLRAQAVAILTAGLPPDVQPAARSFTERLLTNPTARIGERSIFGGCYADGGDVIALQTALSEDVESAHSLAAQHRFNEHRFSDHWIARALLIRDVDRRRGYLLSPYWVVREVIDGSTCDVQRQPRWPYEMFDVCWLSADLGAVDVSLSEWLNQLATVAAERGDRTDLEIREVRLPGSFLWDMPQEDFEWGTPQEDVELDGALTFLQPATGTYLTYPAWESAREALERGATALLPSWVEAVGPLRLVPQPVELGPSEGEAPSADQRTLIFVGDLPASQLSTGQQRWAAICLQLAYRTLRTGVLCDDGLWQARSPDLVILDEPELHLHPLAQREAAEWLRDRALEGSSRWIVATHSPTILNLDPDVLSVVLVSSDPRPDPHDIASGAPAARVWQIGFDLLGHIDAHAAELGITRADWLQLVRGVIIVEGKHDELVLRRFYGDRLARERLEVLALRGTRNAQALIESDFLARSGIPLWVLFDNVRHTTRSGHRDSRPTQEERAALHLRELARQGVRLEQIPYADPDIVCALPEVAVRSAYPQVRMRGGWQAVVDAWHQQIAPENFKDFALRHIGLPNVRPTDFVGYVLDHIEPGQPANDALRRAMDTLFASLRSGRGN